MKIQHGQLAPDFSLYDSNKNKVTLSETREQNVLLLFFPAAFRYLHKGTLFRQG